MSETSATRRRPRRRMVKAALRSSPLTVAYEPPLEAPPVPEPAATILREIVALYRQSKALPAEERPDVCRHGGRAGGPASQALDEQIAVRARAFWKLIDL